MATRKIESTPAPLGELVNEVLGCKIVAFRQHDGLLETDGVMLGDKLEQGRFSGARVTGLFVTQHGCVVELDHAGQRRAVLHTGDYAAELVDE